MVLCAPLPDVLMRTVAEGSVRGHLTVAKLVIARFTDIEGDWTAPSEDPFALPIAHWVDLTVAAGAPVVRFAAGEEHVSGEDTCVSGHARRSVSSLLVWS